MPQHKGKTPHLFQLTHILALLTLILLQTARSQADMTWPFSDLPIGSVAGIEGNPAASSAGDAAYFSLLAAGDTSSRQQFGTALGNAHWGSEYRISLLHDEYHGQVAALRTSFALGSKLDAGVRAQYFEQLQTTRLTLDLGTQWTPTPQLKLGYYTRNLYQNGPRTSIEQNLGFGFRPWGAKQGNGSHFELGAGSEWKSAEAYPYTFVKIPLGGGLLAQGFWTPRTDHLAFSFTAALRPHLKMGLGSDPKQSEIKLAWTAKAATHYGLKSSCARKLDLNQTIRMRNSAPGLFGSEGLDLETVLRRFDFLERDPSAQTVVLSLGRMRIDFASAEELHARILKLRALGKTVIAYLNPEVSAMNYLVASAANRIAVQPMGYFAVHGFSNEVTFYKGFLDKMGVEAQFLRHGKSKAFVEPFLRTNLSEEAKADQHALLSGWWNHYVHTVGSGRGISENSVRDFMNRGEIALDSARAYKLIDTVVQEDEIAGVAGKTCVEPAEAIAEETRWGHTGSLAVISFNGDIVSGQNRSRGLFGNESMGEASTIDLLKKISGQAEIKALVIRLNSPGGLAQASDRIAREIDLLRKQGKIVVISVGGVAASGAYYMACRANAIVAEPSSIVGSIGVVWGKVVTQGLYQKLGLTREVISSAPHADAKNSARPWDSSEVVMLQTHLDAFYTNFIGKVQEGRQGKIKHIDSVGEGKIFTGIEAKSLGLVDTLGGLELAIQLAGKLANLPAYEASRWVRILPAAEMGLVSSPMAKAISELEAQIEMLQEWERAQFWALNPNFNSMLNGIDGY